MSKKALFVLSGAAIPATMQAAVTIWDVNLSITSSTDSIGFNPASGVSQIGSVPAGNSFGLSYSNSDLGKPQVAGASSISQQAEVAYYVNSAPENRAENFPLFSEVGASASWIGTGSSVLMYKSSSDSKFVPGTRGYLGLRTGNGTDWNYAWADVTYGADFSLTLHRVGYESELNVPISPVPEAKPGWVAAFAAGSLVAWRARQLHRRNRQRSAAEAAAAV